ncbi:hypothetical protein Tco_0586998 [Tanacetum coccineum]
MLSMNSSEIVCQSNDDNFFGEDDSTYVKNIEYVNASTPPRWLRRQLRGGEIGDPKLKIDDDILLTIKDDILREKLLNVNLLIAKIDALRDNPTPSSEFPPADRSDLNHEEFADELTHIMSLPELECFKFKIEPDPGDLTSIDLGIRKNASTTNVNVPLEDDQSSLFAYVVWIFLAFLTYPVVPPYLLSTGNEDTIFDPGISIYHSLMPDVSHRSGTFIINDFPDCENSRACSIPHEFHILSFILGIQTARSSEKSWDDEFIRQDIVDYSDGVYLSMIPVKELNKIKEVKHG